MATLVGTEKNIITLLKDLIELDYDAIEAYQAAISRLKDSSYKEALTVFKDDHERHTRNVGNFVIELGETPPTKGDVKAILTKGKVVIASLMGDDAILMAMLSNEKDTNTAYDRASSNPNIPSHIRMILSENFKDEQRHKEWIEMTLKQIKGQNVSTSSTSVQSSGGASYARMEKDSEDRI